MCTRLLGLELLHHSTKAPVRARHDDACLVVLQGGAGPRGLRAFCADWEQLEDAALAAAALFGRGHAELALPIAKLPNACAVPCSVAVRIFILAKGS